MSTAFLRYWHIFGKREIKERVHNLYRRDITPRNLCYHIVTKVIHSWQLAEGSKPLFIYEHLPVLPMIPPPHPYKFLNFVHPCPPKPLHPLLLFVDLFL